MRQQGCRVYRVSRAGMTVGCRSPRHSTRWPGPHASGFGRSIPTTRTLSGDRLSSAMTIPPVFFDNGSLSAESNRHVADHRQKDGQ
jgi:hypothetical protein